MPNYGRKLLPTLPPMPRTGPLPLSAAVALGLALALSACASDTTRSAGPGFGSEPGASVTPSWREERAALGKATYEDACAACHESGQNGAPRTGQREDWKGRSDLWQAVLFNHAKQGYLDMPGKGGQPDLSDQAVEAAAEYMLNRTFPDLPED